MRSMMMCAVAVVLGAGAVQAQSDQGALARQLAETSRDGQMIAADRIAAIPVAEITPGLRRALIAALEREVDTHDRARREGRYLHAPELIARLAYAAYRLEDPSAIPALAGALGSSPPATVALGRFGEPAAGPVLEVLRGSDDGSVLMDGLAALRFMVEGHGGAPLSAATRAEVVDLTARYLAEPGFVTTLWRAIDLAVALDAPELLAVVQGLATDRDAVVQRGVVEDDLIERTQRLAADRLAGVPARPACCPEFSGPPGPIG